MVEFAFLNGLVQLPPNSIKKGFSPSSYKKARTRRSVEREKDVGCRRLDTERCSSESKGVRRAVAAFQT